MNILKSFLLLAFTQIILGTTIHAQDYFKVKKIKLPADISYYDNQFSSLYIAQDNLYLMSECRIEDKSPAYIAYASLEHLDKAIKDSNYMPVFHRIYLKGLDVIAGILKDRKQSYEGFEAMAINNNTYYFSIETDTPSDSCYIIKGDLVDSAIQLNTTHFLTIAKPKDENGKAIYNTGFESMEINNGKLYAFFEYNYFNNGNYVVTADLSLNNSSLERIPIAKIPFRITDVTWDKKENCYWAINYFFQGGGKDTVYRVPKDDPNFRLMYPYVPGRKPCIMTSEEYDKMKNYDKKEVRSYCRIVKIKQENGQFSYEPLADLPEQYWAYNWEGLARYKNGFFITNDKYTPKRPYSSELLYLKPRTYGFIQTIMGKNKIQ